MSAAAPAADAAPRPAAPRPSAVEREPRRRPVGIGSALLALALAVGWLQHYAASAQRDAAAYVRALGPQNLMLKAQTLTLQRAALRAGDVLPIYGTSELYCCAGSDNAGTFFKNAPTGFAVFNVGYPVTEDLFWAQTFGALGSALRGKKLVVSDSPWFTSAQGIGAGAYAHTFSPEIAEVFTFDAPVPLGLRAAVAQRMLDFPTTLQAEPLLRMGLQDLARGGWRGDGAYLLLDPLGRMAAWTAQLQDARQTVQALNKLAHPRQASDAAIQQALWDAAQATHPAWWRRLLLLPAPHPPTPLYELMNQAASLPQPLSPAVPDKPQTIDWNAQLRAADELAAKLSSSNPFGVVNTQWSKCADVGPVSGPWCQRALQLYRSGKSNHDGAIYPVPKGWEQGVVSCPCWTDLDLELEVLRAVQAQPLVWVQPLQGYLADYTPYSASARRPVYDRFMAIARAEGVPATTFQTHDTDPLYIDSFGHLSPRGWVYADRLLDLFWHGQLDQVGPELARGGSVDALFPAALNCPKPAYCVGVSDAPPLPGELAHLPVGAGGLPTVPSTSTGGP